ncbi:MAG: tRNA (adenosine(37)-N6)-threonylcarbamoyltransferase complex transferase subunit TsaD [Peptostreptococcales bacterium]|jgi:N6-L-threonylcarbamoyladenine synthase
MKNKEEVIILAIESSCDETAVSISKNGRDILSNIIATQIKIHEEFGGVVPEIASRHHLDNINHVIDEALKEAELEFHDLDAIAVTYGPGLVGALLVGLSTAKALSYALHIPLIGVHHIEGHICANYIAHKELKPPFLGLILSGGHTHIIDVLDYQKYDVLGKTRDDAVGEAYDKVARVLGLGYPGGPKIDEIAKKGKGDAIAFPRVSLEKGSLDFSFSGIKTAVLNYVNSQKQKNIPICIEDIAASFQKAVVDVIVQKTIHAAQKAKREIIVVAGGVAANSLIRETLKRRAEEEGMKVYYPPIDLCTDNAAMIGCRAYYDYIEGKSHDLSLDAYPNLKLEAQ